MAKWIFAVLFSFSFLLNAQQPYVILISFDGFRYDYPDRGLTPNLAKMEEHGVRALSFRPVFPSKTFPNHLSIVTGMYPENHGVILNGFTDKYKGVRYSLGNRKEVKTASWYWGEFFWTTAEKQGITTASFFWPGSELEEESLKPTYAKAYEHHMDYSMRVSGVLNWLQLPQEKRPHFITLYFDATDSYGHKYGTESKELNSAIARLDSMILMLNNGLTEIGMKDSVNVIVVSDHGMSNVSGDRVIRVDEIISKEDYTREGDGPVMMVFPEEGKLDVVYNKLKKAENHYICYKKEDVPSFYHFSENYNISPIVLIADNGWSLLEQKGFKKLMGYDTFGATHGYDNNCIDMHGIFIAEGPAFKQGYKTGTVWNIDVYPLLCKIFGIYPRKNIDGKLERIEFVLKNR